MNRNPKFDLNQSDRDKSLTASTLTSRQLHADLIEIPELSSRAAFPVEEKKRIVHTPFAALEDASFLVQLAERGSATHHKLEVKGVDLALSLETHIAKRVATYQSGKKCPKISLIPMLPQYISWDKSHCVRKFSLPELEKSLVSVSGLQTWKAAAYFNLEANFNLEAIFVVDENYNFYRTEKYDGVYHHSTFFDGQPIKYAGTFIYDENQQLKTITLSSGHYQPNVDTLLGILLLLHQKKFNFNKITVRPFACATIDAYTYLINESKAFAVKIQELTIRKKIDELIELLKHLPEMNYPLYNADAKGGYKPLYPTEIIGRYLHVTKLAQSDYQLIISILSQTKSVVLARKAIRDLIPLGNLTVSSYPSQNYLMLSLFMKFGIAYDLLCNGVLNVPQWLPLLLQYGMDIADYTSDGMTLLSYFCTKDTPENIAIIKLLLQLGARVNQHSGSAHRRIVQSEESLYSNHPYRDIFSEPPLERAVRFMNLNAIRILLAAGAKIRLTGLVGCAGLNILQTIMKPSDSETIQIRFEAMKLILNAIKSIPGALNIYNNDGYTAVHSIFTPRCFNLEQTKEILMLMKTCQGVDFTLKTNGSPKRSLADLAILYFDQTILLDVITAEPIGLSIAKDAKPKEDKSPTPMTLKMISQSGNLEALKEWCQGKTRDDKETLKEVITYIQESSIKNSNQAEIVEYLSQEGFHLNIKWAEEQLKSGCGFEPQVLQKAIVRQHLKTILTFTNKTKDIHEILEYIPTIKDNNRLRALRSILFNHDPKYEYLRACSFWSRYYVILAGKYVQVSKSFSELERAMVLQRFRNLSDGEKHHRFLTVSKT